MRRLAELVVKRRVWVVIAWVIVIIAAAPFSGRVEREMNAAAEVRGSEAMGVARSLTTRFKTPFALFAVLVVSGVPSPDSHEGRAILTDLIREVKGVHGVTDTFSYLDVADTLFLASGRNGTFLIAGLDRSAGRPEDRIPVLRDATATVGKRLAQRYPGAMLRWTGDIPINFDLRRTSAVETTAAELRVFPVTLLLLLIAFGALVAAILPLIAAGLSIVIALGAAVIINQHWPLSILIQNMVSMIGLGVGIDYALLTVSRFREARASGLDSKEAAVEAAHHAGGTIALSGITVMIGFTALTLVPLNELQSVGVGGLIVVAVAVLVAATLLPALLSWLGPWVDAGRLRLPRKRPGSAHERWRAWGKWVVGNPWRVLFLAGIPTLLLAWQALRIRPELPRGHWMPATMESAAAATDLEKMHRGGIVNELRVLVEYPEGVNVYEANGWEATRRVSAEFLRDPRVARVQSVTTIVPAIVPDLRVISMVPPTTLQSFVSTDRRMALVEVVPRDSVNFNDLTVLALDVRRLNAERISGIPGTKFTVGGLPAFNADYLAAIGVWFWWVVALVVGVTLITLMVGFRSVLVPVKALALNLLSVAAAFGALVIVFQDGHGVRFVGLSEPLGAVFPAVPILVFCIVFGLSMDYEVFLVSRVREARRAGASDDEAIVEGLAHTGGVITSAAAIMIAVFAAFTLGSFLFVKVLGLALATAVLVDATVVRMAIGPALLKLAGRWNWWPAS
jgi:putative drug exporter of the RND superfamily